MRELASCYELQRARDLQRPEHNGKMFNDV
jgi:hypothetical protein